MQKFKRSDFSKKCYSKLKQIPKGKVTTYKILAKSLGTTAWRAVGTAMAKNPNLIIVPCHRVVRSDGQIGGYALGTDKKCELLRQEGVEISSTNKVDLKRYLFNFE
jgi:methylated-DNA-[protein]-cysteine S-methyltransferase